MPTRTFAADRSSLVAVTGSQELGGGQDDHLPIGGPWNGYTFRGLVRFALDFANVRRINSANLYLRTTTQVHVGFSSTPDMLVRRATSSWTPNSSGKSWGTSPVVYPGPSTTTTNQYEKRFPTSESTELQWNITGMVRDWAPVAAGGKAAANYGLVLLGVASGDISEVYSFEASSGRPYIVIDYDSDAPPTASMTAPTGTVTTVRPTIAGTGSDPDGDAITAYQVEVRNAALAVVYSATTPGGNLFDHVPTADLPAGALTVRARATAAGVQGAYSADRPFTIDRPATMGAWSAPAASVAGTRRPVHTVAWSDADGDAGEYYNVEIWSTDGAGHVTGTVPVYVKTNQSAGLGASSISHTPAADLPGGPLGARVQVRSRGVWSSWSSWRFYTVVLTVPTVSWIAPETDGGFVGGTSTFVDPLNALANVAVVLATIAYAPPAGTTIATVRRRAEVTDSGVGGPAVGTVLGDGNVTSVPAGGQYSFAYTPSVAAPGWLAGTVRMTFTVTAANSGQTIETRLVRFALGEWAGAVALGDQVAALAAVETPKLDDCALFYRAQTSPTAANGAAPWRALAALATVQAELPATNAYLGVRVRLARRIDDPDLVTNGDFEAGATGPWLIAGGTWGVTQDSNGPVGSSVAALTGDGGASTPTLSQRCPVIAGATYRVSTWGRAATASTTARLQAVTRSAAGSIVNSSALVVSTVSTSWTYLEGYVTIPADGSVATLEIMARLTDLIAGHSARFDGLSLRGMQAGDAGMDRLDLAWTSLG